MIKILEFDKVTKDEIFSRVVIEADVSGIVSEIIENVNASIKSELVTDGLGKIVDIHNNFKNLK